MEKNLKLFEKINNWRFRSTHEPSGSYCLGKSAFEPFP